MSEAHEQPTPDDGRAQVRVYLDRPNEAVVAVVKVRELFQEWLEYATTWQDLPHPRVMPLLEPCLAAVTLHLGSQPPDLHTAWTINSREQAANVFISGDNTNYSVVGRAYSDDVKVGETSRVFLEVQRPRHEPHRSMVSVDGADTLAWFEQFFWRSDQIPTRLFSLGGMGYAMVQGLPLVDREWIAALTAADVSAALARETLELIEDRRYQFVCSCDGDRIRQVVAGLFRDNPEELFQGQEAVETFCPRCGRRWWISREEFRALDN